MTFLQIVQEIADELDLSQPSSVEGTLTQEVRRLAAQVNEAYAIILLALNRKNEYRETSTTFSTAASTESYSIPTGILNVDELRISNDPPIRIIPWPEFQRYKSNTFLLTQTGYPDLAAFYQRKIWFYPIPDAAYTVTLRGQENMTDMSLDASVPDLPADFHRVIKAFALYFAMDYEGNPRAEAQAMRAKEALQLARNNSKDHFTEPPRMIGAHEMGRLSRYRRLIRF